MGAIKAVWITEHDTRLCALSIESEHVKEKHMRVKVHQMEFPEVPSKNNPLRHSISLSLLNDDDLIIILKAIAKYLKWEVV